MLLFFNTDFLKEHIHILPLIFRVTLIAYQVTNKYQLWKIFFKNGTDAGLEPSLKFYKDYIRSSTLKCSMMHSKMNIPHARWHTEHFLRLVPYHKFLVSRYLWYLSAYVIERCALSSNPSSFCSRWLVLTRN